MSLGFKTRQVADVLAVDLIPSFFRGAVTKEDVVAVFAALLVEVKHKNFLFNFAKVKTVEADARRKFTELTIGWAKEGVMFKGFNYGGIKDTGTASDLASTFGYFVDEAAAIRSF